MKTPEEIRNRLFRISGEQEFNELALAIFRHQYESNRIYREFADLIGCKPAEVSGYQQIPFLPIGLFKGHEVVCHPGAKPEKVFTSSGTTGSSPSCHLVTDLEVYRESFTRSFTLFYSSPEKYRFLVLLPGYLERNGSSLVYMMDEFVRLSQANGSGFFLRDFEGLARALATPPPTGAGTILFGASYALSDFAESHSGGPVIATVMETGGMKGRKREMIREELHDTLCDKLGVDVIHSEYGMTELLSQAYSKGNGLFRTPPWMKVIIRDMNDPFAIAPPGKTGGINVIDLANLHSCAFIATQDLGRIHRDGSFEVLGRFDDSDARGCNLLIA